MLLQKQLRQTALQFAIRKQNKQKCNSNVDNVTKELHTMYSIEQEMRQEMKNA